ncbi:MAG: hypothetical protein ACR2J8_09015, partial [Thermomicrobiales bacterium]
MTTDTTPAAATLSRRSLARYVLPAAMLAAGLAGLEPARHAAAAGDRLVTPQLGATTVTRNHIRELIVTGRDFAPREMVRLTVLLNWNELTGTSSGALHADIAANARGAFSVSFGAYCPINVNLSARQRGHEPAKT